MIAQHLVRYIFLAVLCLTSVVPAVAASSSSPSSASRQETRKVRVGYYHIPGFQQENSAGERSGYGYDFLQLARRYSRLEFTYHGYEKSWAESLAMLDAGEIDLLIGALRTPEREQKYDYTFPIGRTELNLYVRNSDVRYRPGDYRSYEGMRIGTVTSEMLDERIKGMAVRRNFGCKVIDYHDFETLCRALDEGKVDAICAIGTHRITGYRILGSFDNENIYAIVRKGNTPLLDMLNDAILKMDQSVTMWPLKLYRDNYMVDHSHALEFSEQELAFIQRHSTPETAIKIATDNTWKPYSWCEDGHYKGIVVEIVDLLMKQAGLQYEFVGGEISSESVMTSRPEVDLYVDFASTKQYAEEQGLVVSPPLHAILHRHRQQEWLQPAEDHRTGKEHPHAQQDGREEIRLPV